MNQKTKQLTGVWWNVLYEARDRGEGAEEISDKIAKLVNEYHLDWVCLQEVFRYHIDDDKRDLVGLIEHKTGWKSIFIPGAQYHYENGVRKHGDNYSDGIATFSKWSIEQNRVKKLNPGRNRFYGDIGTHLLEVTLDTDQGPIVVANTHLTWMSVKNFKHRSKEMKVFLEHVEHIKSDSPYVIGGDFNTISAHPFMISLRKYLDLHTSNSVDPTWRYRGKRKNLLRSNIDYVGTFIQSAVDMTDFEVLDSHPSDHSPLLCTFVMKKE